MAAEDLGDTAERPGGDIFERIVRAAVLLARSGWCHFLLFSVSLSLTRSCRWTIQTESTKGIKMPTALCHSRVVSLPLSVRF